MATDQKEQKAEVAAEKARTKALRPWYKKKRIVIPAVIVGIIAAASAGSSGDNKTTTSGDSGAKTTATDTDSKTTKKADTTPGLNTAARDGKFEFVVTGVTCGKTQVGNEFLNKSAQGQFCEIAVKVSNIGNEPQTMFASNQYVFDGSGRKYAADSEAQIYADDSKTLFEQINPGNSIEGTIIFDVPTGVTPAKALLHDSAFSGGVTVNLK